MAKIDLTSIENYENMTAEEKLAALENFDIPEPDHTGWIRKDLYDKAASGLAKEKKERKSEALASEQAMADLREQFATENAELKTQLETMQTTLNGYKREKDIANLTARYTQLGYGDLAESTAIAHLDGDTDTVFKNQQSIIDKAKQASIEDKTVNTPNPPAGNPKDNPKDEDDAFTRGFMKS